MGTEIEVRDEEKEGFKLKYKKKPTKEEEKNSDYTKDKKEEIKEEKPFYKKEGIKLDKSEDENEKIIFQKILVKIKIEGGFWEKKFDKDTKLNEIVSEFKEANNLEKIKKNHYIDFIYNNSSLQMDSRTLNSIIKEGQKEIIIEHEIKKLPGIEKIENIEPVDYIGKPMYNPFEIYILEIKRKIISKIKYSKKKEEKFELNKYGKNSAYCNGINHLFISGGTDPFSNNILNMFWDIDLENKEFKERIMMPIPKKNHNMIYIGKKVYIVGGNDESTMYYDLNNKNIVEWVKLKKKKFEPSLIKYNIYLFCIDSSRKYLNDYNFEKINLIEENPEWEVVKPRISPDILNLTFSQRFFGLIEDKNENIIFIGGIFDNNIENEEGKNEYFNLQYNDDENLIQRSNMILKINDYHELNLTEKTFLPVDKNTYVIFPDFKKRAPKVLYFYKDRNYLEMNSYHSNPKLTKMVNNNRIVSLGESLKELNLNMPSLNNNKNIYLNNELNPRNFDLEKSKLAPEYKNYIRIHLNNNSINNYNTEKNDMKFITNNIDLNNKKEKEKEVMLENNDINSNRSNNILKKIPTTSNKSKDDNISNKIKGEDNININDNLSEEKKIEKNENNIDSNIIDKNKDNIKDEFSKKSIKSKDDSDNKISNKGNDIDNKEEKKEIVVEPEKEEEKKEEEKKEEKKEEKEEEKKEEDNKEENEEKIIIKNKDNNIEESEEITKKSSFKKNEKSLTNIEIFDYDKAYSLITFHSSVNNALINNLGNLENNKAVKNNLKLKHFVQPKEKSVKYLKKARRKFKNFEINGFNDNNY